jgi:hypothetical protein
MQVVFVDWLMSSEVERTWSEVSASCFKVTGKVTFNLYFSICLWSSRVKVSQIHSVNSQSIIMRGPGFESELIAEEFWRRTLLNG